MISGRSSSTTGLEKEVFAVGMMLLFVHRRLDCRPYGLIRYFDHCQENPGIHWKWKHQPISDRDLNCSQSKYVCSRYHGLDDHE